MIFEYEEAIKRDAATLNRTLAGADKLLDALCLLAIIAASRWNTP